MSSPVFSIITPTCRRPQLLKRNILSVQNQTFGDYEHIIVDDASDIETGNLITEFQDNRIVCHSHTSPRGAAGSYNTGIRMARGTYILFLDDDDEYLPCFLKKIHDRFSLAGPDTGFIWTGISRVRDTEEGEKLLFSRIWPERFPSKETGLAAATSIGNGFGVCVRRVCIENTGLYDESLKVCEDTDFLFRLALKYTFETIPEVLVKIHQHGNPQLNNEDNFLQRLEGKEKIINRYEDILKQYPAVYYIHYKSYAGLCYSHNLRLKGRQAMFSIIKNSPLRFLNFADLFFYELLGKDATGFYTGSILYKIRLLMKRNKN
jgi:glycosyltransferase involved in cell wall biosynthesis